MSGLKKHNRVGKEFSKKNFKLGGGDDDALLSYEEMAALNEVASKPNQGFFNLEINEEGEAKHTAYIPKKTRNKKDVMAAHRRSTKKTNRRLAKLEIDIELNNE